MNTNNIRVLVTGFLVTTLLFLNFCASTATAGTKNVTRPVIIGETLNPKGDSHANKQVLGELNISTQDYEMISSSEYQTEQIKIVEGPQKFDAGIEGAIIFPNQYPRVTEIKFGSWIMIMGAYARKAYVEIDGEIIHIDKKEEAAKK